MIELLLFLALIGVIAWALVTYLPMPQPVKTVIVVAAVLICVLILVRALGLDLAVPRLGT
jgi:hypothetical protein